MATLRNIIPGAYSQTPPVMRSLAPIISGPGAGPTLRTGFPLFLGLVLVLGFGQATAAQTGAKESAVDFNRDIRPILSNRCTGCHGGVKRKAGLSFLSRHDVVRELESGERAVVPGKPEASEMFRRITSTDDEERMPPKDDPLTPAQIQKLRLWIEAGGLFPQHWSFAPLADKPPPKVKTNDHSWARNEIDYYVLKRLVAKGIKPSAEADPYTLIRRLSLDLTGLPPTPLQTDQFIKDTSPDAYRKLVDRLLASPRHGERWGKHWLDQARYADSNGYSIDSPRSLWPWRDWVIKALNDDMPFDRFTIEQLAGDLLPKPTKQQLIATGFHRNTLVNQEGGSDREQFRVEAVVDRVNTTSAVWLGVTIACVQCHNHPFDPFVQRDFYQLLAFFNSDEDANNTGPTVRISSAANVAQRKSLQQQLSTTEKNLAQYDKGRSALQRQWERNLLGPLEKNGEKKGEKKGTGPARWTTAAVKSAKSAKGATLSVLQDQSVLASGKNAPHDTYRIELRPTDLNAPITAVRLELLPDKSLPNRGPGRASNGNIVMSGFELFVGKRSIAIAHATSSHSQKGYVIGSAIDGKKTTGWAINGGGAKHPLNGPHQAVFVLKNALILKSDQVLGALLKHERPDNADYQIGRFKLSLTAAKPAQLSAATDRSLIDAARTAPAKRSKKQRELLARAFGKSDSKRRDTVKQIDQLKKKIAALDKKTPSSLVMRQLSKPRKSFIHIRGDFLRKGDPVKPNFPAVLASLNGTAGNKQPATRLDLARWLVSKGNPLTPRVTVNRIWMRYFGRGLVETENDFGSQGSSPTHPQLLDYLAGQFIKGGWSFKNVHRLIVHSATYRQSSRARPDLNTVDPRNLLLAKQNRLRVEAEIIRDQALAVSGLLDDRIGGPGVYPPQPAGVYNFTQRKQSWKTSSGPDRYRRGMYIFFYRSSPYPMLTTFDAPNFTNTCTSRIRSNTPLQSLTLANDPVFIEAAGALAMKVLADDSTSPRKRMGRAFRLCLVRQPGDLELDRLMKFLDSQLKRFAEDKDAAKQFAPAKRPPGVSETQAAAWTSVARVLINLDEFVTRP